MTRIPAFEDFSRRVRSGSESGIAGYMDAVRGTADPDQASAEFETGYEAGWADATRAAQEEQAHIRAELAHNLRDIGFTYYEARAHVLRALEPLLLEIIDKLFPELVRETLAQHILDVALPRAREVGEAPLEVVISPAARSAVEPVLKSISQADFIVRDEPTLGEGQAMLRVGKSELSIDPAEILNRIRTALTALSDINKEDLKHG